MKSLTEKLHSMKLPHTQWKFFRTLKKHKAQNIYQNIFPLVGKPVSTTEKLHNNKMLKTYKSDISWTWSNDNFKGKVDKTSYLSLFLLFLNFAKFSEKICLFENS